MNKTSPFKTSEIVYDACLLIQPYTEKGWSIITQIHYSGSEEVESFNFNLQSRNKTDKIKM